LVLLLASCLVWIGGISLAVAFFLGTAVTTGWILAGALFLAVCIWCVVMIREIRQAIELPDYPANDEARDMDTRSALDPSSTAFRAQMRAAFERPGLEERRVGRRSRRRSRNTPCVPGQAAGKR
jgi:type VI protein secretion system component VasK